MVDFLYIFFVFQIKNLQIFFDVFDFFMPFQLAVMSVMSKNSQTSGGKLTLVEAFDQRWSEFFVSLKNVIFHIREFLILAFLAFISDLKMSQKVNFIITKFVMYFLAQLANDLQPFRFFPVFQCHNPFP